MIALTYALQAFSCLIGGGAALLMIPTWANERYGLLFVQVVIILVNVALFLWQAMIRAALT